jgi:hypothetical protein
MPHIGRPLAPPGGTLHVLEVSSLKVILRIASIADFEVLAHSLLLYVLELAVQELPQTSHRLFTTNHSHLLPDHSSLSRT